MDKGIGHFEIKYHPDIFYLLFARTPKILIASTTPEFLCLKNNLPSILDWFFIFPAMDAAF